jgi:hypothetical protein
MSSKRKISGGLLALIGFLLSPLSWWNDAFINLPIALVFGWLVSAPFAGELNTTIFRVAVVAGYWLTNVLGLVLLHKGTRELLARGGPAPSGNLRRDILISLAYTLLIVVLIKFGVLKPFAAYFTPPN